MENTENRREHYNLYYIFEADKQEHPMPPEMVEKIRKNIFEKNPKKLKLLNIENPPWYRKEQFLIKLYKN